MSMALGIMAVPAIAQVPSAFIDYEDRLRSSEMVEPLGSDLFGENVSLFNGATEFAVTDVDIPGNSALPVRVGRRFKINVRERGILTSRGFSSDPVPLGGFGMWDLDIPYIHGTFDAAHGWRGYPNDDRRCSGPVLPRISSNFDLADVWSGYRLSIPWAGEQEMTLLGSEHVRPADGQTYRWGTRENYRIRCISGVVNYSGEGFVAVDPSGLKYTFNVAVFRDGGLIEKRVALHHAGYDVLQKQQIFLFVSRIEDRFGNYVQYHYNGDKLTQIAASDGRVIDVHWSGSVINRIVSGSREWLYTYGAGWMSVRQPDDAIMRYDYVGALHVQPAAIQDGTPGLCIEPLPDSALPFAMIVTHPSGAVGRFDFAYMRHGRSGTPASACVIIGHDVDGNPVRSLALPDYSFTYSLVSKSITGHGLPAATWSYGWDGPETGRASFSGAYCTSCDPDRSAFVAQPDGSTMEHVFGALWNHNEGRLLATHLRDANGVLVRSEISDYVTDAQVPAMPFPDSFGTFTASDSGAVLHNRPLKSRRIEQDGVSFRWNATTFDAFVRPVQVVRSSTLPGSPSRTEATAYHDNHLLWVLGQTASMTCMASSPADAACSGNAGSVVSATAYDASAQPVSFAQYGKPVQTRTYDMAASIDSGQRGTLRTVGDGNGNTVTVTDWKRGIPRSINYPATPEASAGSSRMAAVNDHGWITAVTDELGAMTCYAYDPMGRITQVTYPSETATHVCDDSAWVPTTSAFARSQVQKYGLPAGHWQHVVSTGAARKVTYFDALWRPVVTEAFDNSNGTMANATRSIAVQRYDASGRKVFQSYPQRTLTNFTATTLTGEHFTYDTLNRRKQAASDWEGPGRLLTQTEYLGGFRTRVTPPRGQGAGAAFQTTTSYLAWDQPTTDFPIAIIHPEGAFTDIARDAQGKPTSLTRRNAGGSTELTRAYRYDAYQQLCKTVEPETGATIMAYDGAGNLAWSKSGATQTSLGSCNTTAIPVAQRTVRTYDARNRLTALAFPDGRGNQTWSYTRTGLPATITTRNSSAGDIVTNTYAYNRRQLPVSETFAVNSQLWALGFHYSPLGFLSSQTTPGLTLDYAPNALGQPTRAGTYATAVSHFPNGGVQQFTYGNGIKRTLTQNSRGLPQNSCDFAGSSCTASAILRDTYDYDGHGNVLAITDGRTGSRGNRDMTYDALDRLIQTISPMFGTASYGYDVLDNLRTVRVTSGPKVRNHTYIYDATNRLTNVTNTVGGATVTGLGYDAQGNLANKNGVLHDFDFGNRLRQVSGAEQYQYDGHGRRVLSTRDGQHLYSLYGQDGVLRFQRDERTGKTIDYVHLGGQLVAQVENALPVSTPTLSAPAYSATGSFTVSWNGVALASRYQLQQRLGTGTWAQVHDAAATSVSITGRSAGSWEYRVRACHPTSCGNWSATATVTVELPPASPPSLTVPATSTTGAFTASWTSVATASSYQLQESVNSGTWNTLHEIPGTSVALTGRTNGAWSYRVSACNPAGCSAYSATRTTDVTLPPSSVPTLTVPATNATGSYTVSWNSVATATRYELEERLGVSAWGQIHDAAATTKAISSKTTGSWDYRVRGCNGGTCGNWSATATTQVTLPPASPPVLTVPATNATGSFTASWTSVDAATRYELDERLGSGAWSTVHNASATSKAVSGKASGTWGYRVRACNNGGCSANSAISNTVVTLPPTGVPTISGPSTGINGSYSLSWTSVTAATRYELEERRRSGSWLKVHDDAATSKAISGKASDEWDYRVRACNTGGCAAWSAIHTVQVIHQPTAPPTLTVPASNLTGSYTVSWTTVATATRYELEQQLNGGGWTQVHNDAQNSMAINGRTTGSWGYRVRACNQAGCSDWSNVATVAVTRPPAGAPSLTAPASNGTGQYGVSWTTVTHATRYELQERLGTGAWALVHNGGATSHAATGKGSGIWGYRVRACNTAGCGDYSSVVTVTVLLLPPTPTGLSAHNHTYYVGQSVFTSCSVTWNSATDAATYQLGSGVIGLYEGTSPSYAAVSPNCSSAYVVRACNARGCSAWSAPVQPHWTYDDPPPDPGPGFPVDPTSMPEAGDGKEGGQ